MKGYNFKNLGEAGNRISLEPSEGHTACQHLDFSPVTPVSDCLTSRTEREQGCAILNMLSLSAEDWSLVHVKTLITELQASVQYVTKCGCLPQPPEKTDVRLPCLYQAKCLQLTTCLLPRKLRTYSLLGSFSYWLGLNLVISRICAA